MSKTLTTIFFLSFFLQNLFSQTSEFANSIKLDFVRPEQTQISTANAGMPAPIPELLAKISFTVSDFERTDKIEIHLSNTDGDKYVEANCSIRKTDNKFFLFYNDELSEIQNNTLNFEFPVDKKAENENTKLKLRFFKNQILIREQ